MSLIYDALRSQGAARPDSASPVPLWWARQSSWRRGSLLLATGALLATPLAFVAATVTNVAAPTEPRHSGQPSVAQPVEAPAEALTLVDPLEDDARGDVTTDDGSASASAVPLPSPEPMPVAVIADTAIASTADIATPENALLADAVASPMAGIAGESLPPQHGHSARAAESATPMPAPAPVRQAMAATSSPSAAASIRVERRDASVPAGQLDDAMVLRATQALEAAVAADDMPAAHAELARLEDMLPASSLTLLRMRAWVAHGSRDMTGAEALYRQIIERVPDDMNAGVNIALLDARRGDVGDARDRLTRLAARHLRSPQVTRALAELDTLTQ